VTNREMGVPLSGNARTSTLSTFTNASAPGGRFMGSPENLDNLPYRKT